MNFREMRMTINRWFILDSEAHYFYHHHRTELGYFDLATKMRYTVKASLCNTFMEAVLAEKDRREHIGEHITNAKWGAIQNTFHKQLIEFSEVVNGIYGTDVKIPHSRRFRRMVSEYAKVGYVALIDGRTGNQNAKRTTPNPRIENLKALYLQGFPYKEIAKRTGYAMQTICNYRKQYGWAKIAKWENGNRRNTRKANKPETPKQATAPPKAETDKDNVSGWVLIAKWNNSNEKSYRKFLPKHQLQPSKDGKQTGGV